MPRFFVKGEWFELLAPMAHYESNYQDLIIAEAAHLFPDYHCVRFGLSVDSPYGKSIPDAALIDKQYRFWWVVEIERSDHDFYEHVEPQIRRLSMASYDQAVADYLHRQAPSLSRARLRAMMKGESPRVLVVVNGAVPSWLPELKAYGAVVTVVEVYRSNRNRICYRVNGTYPSGPSGVLSECYVPVELPMYLRILSPGALPVSDGDSILIYQDAGAMEWVRRDISDAVMLRPVGPMNLRVGATYTLLELGSGELWLEERRVSRRHTE